MKYFKFVTLFVFTFMVTSVAWMGIINFAYKGDLDKLTFRLNEAIEQGVLDNSEYSPIKFNSFKFGYSDNHSECISLSMSLVKGEVIPYSIRPVVKNVEEPPCSGLIRLLTEKQVTYNEINYSRFFHGASAVSELFLKIVSLKSAHLIVAVCLFLICAITMRFIWAHSNRFVFVYFLYAFVATDTLFESLTLTRGVPTLFALIFAYLAGQAAVSGYFKWAVSFGVIGGASYGFLAMLYTPIQFALLSSLFVQIGISKVKATRNDVSKEFFKRNLSCIIFFIWILSYGTVLVLRYFQTSILLEAGAANSEFVEGITSKISQNLSDLVYPMYAHFFLYPGENVLLMLAILVFSFLFGRHYSFEFVKKSIRLNFSDWIPILVAFFWLIVMGEHNSHRWVMNLIFTIALSLLFLIKRVAFEAGQRLN